MRLPLAHQARLAGQFEEENKELHAQLHAKSASHSHDDDGSQSQGSKGSGSKGSGSKGSGEGGGGAEGIDVSLTKPPKDLPCPRCKSANTKFCYYNNYSVNQPRHFCRNCQRYWTVGGTLRNVPVGGGSRKKSRTRSRSDPYYRPGSVNSPVQDHSSDAETEQYPAPGMESMEAMAAMAAMAEMAGLDGALGGFGEAAMPEFPFHPSQVSALLQMMMMQNAAGMYSPFPPAAAAAEEAEAEFLSSAAAMMFMPQLEPAHLELMHKATLWAEAQQLQAAVARRQSQAAWVAEEREGKPQPQPQPQPQPSHRSMDEFLQRQQQRHPRPSGFWENALMHSRPPSKQQRTPARSASTLDEEASNLVNGSSSFSHGYDDSSSWGSAMPGASDLYYNPH